MNKCKICSSEKIKVIHEGTRDRADVNVLKCIDCGLVFLSKILTDDEFYSDGEMRKYIDFEKWRKNTYIDDKRRYLQNKELILGKNILDFGCGNGGFLKLAKNDANQICGLDLDIESVNYLNHEGIECYQNVFELPDIKFDIIFMFHVVEHLPDPKQILYILADHLTEKGIIVMETPNADDALLSLYDCKAFADFTYWSPHIYLYNEFTLSKMLISIDFRILNMFQFQRYSIANHLKWLSKGLPGGGGRFSRI